ncbi:MAG: hypothetical protein QF790_04695 [Gammaproteobacteria bacterium]|jgi:hypothetical protein|nr:hypothetical protein [Gammaproteobacteria bacterium]MDP6616447.1 hypothetical protein [Gammaproteobacteria bacterium]
MSQSIQKSQDASTAGPDASTIPVSLAALLLTGMIGWLTFSLQLPDTGGTDLAPREMEQCVMDRSGFLRGELYGAVRQTLDWQGEAMACDGMPRPEGKGIRLAFREKSDPDNPGLMFVVGIEDAVPGEDTVDLPANVTLNDQPGGRFFGTQGEQSCWVTLTEQVRLKGTIEEVWRFDGLLYCASALPAAAGSGSVTLGELEFSGQYRAVAD